jgi:hypothetical protein
MSKSKISSRKNVRISRPVRKTEHAVRVVGNKIETNPRLMLKNQRYPVTYNGKKYYVIRTGEYTFELNGVK